jgi:IS605 OrfB family transposase
LPKAKPTRLPTEKPLPQPTINHKILANINKIIIGNVKTKEIQKNKASGFNRSLYDASWFQLKTTLEYKAQLLGGEYVEISEAYTTVTCSKCLALTGPKGTNQLGIREWICSKCGSFHDRDHNAALNILRLGHQTLVPA